MRLTLDEYSKQFKMSKELINSKLRAKTLNYIIENGTTYIIVQNKNSNNAKSDELPQIQRKPQTVQNVVVNAVDKPRTTVAVVLALYQRENAQLKEKINFLEEKIDKLIDDKEQLLRAERDKIEEIYTAKDTQLKSILELINTKLMLEQKVQTIHEVEALSKEENLPVENLKEESLSELIELREYLKQLDLKSYQKKIIKKRFYAAYNNDIRIIQQNGKIYLDLATYDYSDLLSH